jgi:Tfp pilus assembly protein PilO
MRINLSSMRLKPQRGLTAREFILLALLIIAIEGYFIISYILVPAYDSYVSATDDLAMRKEVLAELKRDFVRKSAMEEEIKKAEEKLAVIQEQLPPYVSQEEVIFFLEDVSYLSGLTIQSIAFHDTDELPLTVLPPEGTGEKVYTGAAPTPVIVEQKIGINFMGNYQQLYDFLDNVESSFRKVCMKSMTMQKNNEGLLNGVLTLSFTSYWDDHEGRKPYVMVPTPTPGKASLFDEYTGYSIGAQAPVEVQRPAAKPDFYITLNSYLNNSAKIFMMNYYKSGSEAIEDKNEIVNARMTLNEVNGQYTFSYSLGAYDIVEDSPTEIKDGKIRMEVLVQPRQSDQDRVGLVLDITNNTSVPFEITVKGDDPSNPRFITGQTSGSVVVR